MKIVRNRYLPFKGYAAINLLGLLFCRPGVAVTPELVNHERIHTRQMLEMFVVFFYLWYLIEWLIRLPMKGSAYYNLAFEREAYLHQNDMNYLSRRRHYAWFRLLLRRTTR